MTDEQINKRVAVEVMGWWSHSGIWCEGSPGDTGTGTEWISFPVTGTAFQYVSGKPENRVFSPVTDIRAAMQVEDRIAELGLKGEYIAILSSSLVKKVDDGHSMFDLFELVHATARQRSEAALKAVETNKVSGVRA